MKHFLHDRRVAFAIGVATTLLAIKWLFSDSLLFATTIIEEGKTGSTTTAILPLLLDGFVALMVGIGTHMVSFGLFVAGRVQSLVAPVAAPPGAAPEPAAPTADRPLSVTADPASLTALRDELADAVAAADTPRENEARRRLRLPFAMAEMNAAYAAGDTATGRKLSEEVERLIGLPPTTAPDKSGESPPEATERPPAKRSQR